MYTSVLALLCRALRTDTRSRSSHLVRLILLGAIYLALIQTQMVSRFMGAPGLNFFGSLLWLNLVFATLIGIGAFSSAITEEKEIDSLGLIKMAGVDSVGLLLGKVGGRLLQALTLLIVQYPFTLLSITLGGVRVEQIQAAYLAISAYLVMLAGLGVLCSTIAQTSRAASRMMVICLVLYCAIPPFCLDLSNRWARSGTAAEFRPILDLLGASSIFSQQSEILATAFGSSLWSVQVVSNVLAGIACFLLSWALFEVCTRNPASEVSSRRLKTTKTIGLRWINPGRPNRNPLGWKDFHFTAGGLAGILLRLGLYLCLYLLILSLSLYWDQGDLESISGVYCVVVCFLLPLDASLLVSHSLQDEVRGQTIPALVMLPQTVPAIVYRKLGGALLGLAPGVACLISVFCASGLIADFLEALTSHPVPTEGLLGILCVISFMLLLPHLTGVISLVVPWGATPIAVGALFAIYTAETMAAMLVIVFVLGMTGGGDATFLLLGATGVHLAFCAACHFELLRRFQKLAER